MDSTIVASLIAAAASILVALLGRTGSPTPARNRGGSTWVYSIPRRHRAIWMTSVGVLVAWMVFAALFLHWDAAGTSAIAIPPVIWILSGAGHTQHRWLDGARVRAGSCQRGGGQAKIWLIGLFTPRLSTPPPTT